MTKILSHDCRGAMAPRSEPDTSRIQSGNSTNWTVAFDGKVGTAELQQDRETTCNVTLMRMRETNVGVGKQ